MHGSCCRSYYRIVQNEAVAPWWPTRRRRPRPQPGRDIETVEAGAAPNGRSATDRERHQGTRVNTRADRCRQQLPLAPCGASAEPRAAAGGACAARRAASGFGVITTGTKRPGSEACARQMRRTWGNWCLLVLACMKVPPRVAFGWCGEGGHITSQKNFY